MCGFLPHLLGVGGQLCIYRDPCSPLLQEWKAAFSSRCILSVGLNGGAESTDLCATICMSMQQRFCLADRATFQRRVRRGVTAGFLMVCGELGVACDVAAMWCFCLFRVPFWIST